MSDAALPDSVPEPKRYPNWYFPPERRWLGNLVFFAAGLAAMLASIYGATRLRFGSTEWMIAQHVWAIPFLVGAALLVQRIRRGPRWRVASYFVGALAIPAATFAHMAVLQPIEHWQRTVGFEPTAWRRAAPADRCWMVADLLDQDRLLGRPIGEVDALLGPDDGLHGTRLAGVEFDQYDRAWYLGWGRVRGEKPGEWLILEVGIGGNVTDARVERK